MSTQTPDSSETQAALQRKVRRVFSGRIHKHDKFEVILEKDARGGKTAVVPYEQTVDTIVKLIESHIESHTETAVQQASRALLERLKEQSQTDFIGTGYVENIPLSAIDIELANLERQQDGKDKK